MDNADCQDPGRPHAQENDLPPSDHVVSLGAVSWQLMELQLVTKPKDRRTIARQQQAGAYTRPLLSST